MSGSLQLVLHTHLPYVMRHGRWPHGSDWLCEAAAECYMPLLNECFDLRAEGIVPAITFSFSPVLLEQLADTEFASLFESYLTDRREAADRDAERFAQGAEHPELQSVAEFWSGWYRDRLADFVERYDRDLISPFRTLREAGSIELQTCGATHGYFPLLGRDESIHVQVQLALDVHHHHFGHRPRGIWMPECAYRPGGYWAPPVASDYATTGMRNGVEHFLRGGHLDHTFVDAHTVRAGTPVDWYQRMFLGLRHGQAYTPLPLADPRSVYEPYSVHATVSGGGSPVQVFARDVETALDVWSSNTGYPGDPVYLEFHKKYHRSGHRYWRITGRDTDLSEKGAYDPEQALKLSRIHGNEFAAIIASRLDNYASSTGHTGTMTLPFDTELFGHWWFEGPSFIGGLIRGLDGETDVTLSTPVESVSREDEPLPVTLPESSWGDGGDHRVWLNQETAWTWPELWKAEANLIELIAERRRENELEERGLRQMGRELLLMQASDWQFLITTGTAVDYATDRFHRHMEDYWLIDRYVRSLRTGVESLDLFDELCRIESCDRLFAEIDLDYWLWKRSPLVEETAPSSR